MDNIRADLFSMQDLGYRKFHAKLIPTVEKSKIIGVRTPDLRRYAAQIHGTARAAEFLKKLPHDLYEEDNLHAFLIEKIYVYGELIRALDEFLPYVDNWATCDMMSPKAFKNNLSALSEKVREWLAADSTYTVRFGIVTLMKLYLQDDFSIEYPELVAAVRRDDYYVKMAVAWYFATALAYQYDRVIPYLTQNRLDIWTHNKTIRKACESFRHTDSCKEYLKSLKR